MFKYPFFGAREIWLSFVLHLGFRMVQSKHQRRGGKYMSLTLEKIFEAKNRIAPYTTRTPLIRLEKLDEHLGCQVYLKAECMQITSAFKLRGAVNKIRMLTPEQLSCGIS